MTKSISLIAAVCMLLVATLNAAHAEKVTTRYSSMACTTHSAVMQGFEAITNKPDSLSIADVIEPLGCVMLPGGLTFIQTDPSTYGAVVSGILITPSGEKLRVYINESGVTDK